MQYLSSSQISHFAVTPNYEIVYFASDVQEVANIIDFRSRKEIQTILEKLELEGEKNELKQKKTKKKFQDNLSKSEV